MERMKICCYKTNIKKFVILYITYCCYIVYLSIKTMICIHKIISNINGHGQMKGFKLKIYNFLNF